MKSLKLLSTSFFWNLLKNLYHEFWDKGCQKSAAALTYMTLFALVPMMTVTYSMFSLIPAFDGVADQLQHLIFSNFVPEAGSEVQQYLSDFSSQARSLTGFGVSMLLITAFLMLTNIERTFNAIWGVEQARRGLSSFLLYWAVLSIGPLLLGAGLLISTYLLSLKLFADELSALGALASTFRFVPLCMATAAFTLLFVAVPNCKVPLKYALVGGATTALFFEFLKAGFGYAVSNSSFQLVYGAFAVVPLFLLWINILWTTILGGAILVRVLAERDFRSPDDKLTDMMAVLSCLEILRERSKTGSAAEDQDCMNAGVGLVHWQKLRALLVKHQWLAVTDEGQYVLCRDLRHATVWDVATLVGVSVEELSRTQASHPLDSSSSAKDSSSDTATVDNTAHADPSKPWLARIHADQDRVSEYARDAFEMDLESLFSLKG